MRYVYRCSACRTRNTFCRPVDSYVRPKRCRSCGHGRFYLDRERMARGSCRCDGYFFPHRAGAACCIDNPRHALHRAKRAGADPDDLLDLSAELAFDSARPLKHSDPCPF